MGVKRAHLYISGLVQGVFYRANMQRKAEELGLSGWVRNLPDGRVEAVAEGDEEALKKLIDWAWRGPPAARVENGEVIWEEPRGDIRGFRIRY